MPNDVSGVSQNMITRYLNSPLCTQYLMLTVILSYAKLFAIHYIFDKQIHSGITTIKRTEKQIKYKPNIIFKLD